MPKSAPTNIYLEVDLKEAAAELAKNKHDLSLSAFIERLLRKELSRDRARRKAAAA